MARQIRTTTIKNKIRASETKSAGLLFSGIAKKSERMRILKIAKKRRESLEDFVKKFVLMIRHKNIKK